MANGLPGCLALGERTFLLRSISDRILGAHILGPNAEEVVNLFGAAIRLGLTAAQLRRVVPAYPSDGANLAYMLG